MRRFFLAAFVTLPLFCATPAHAAPAVIPDVHVTIFRFNADTQQFVGLYELSQPYRKSLPGPGYTQSTNFLVSNWAAGDFGGMDINSRLTGQHILSTTWVWMGTGTFTYPPSSSMSTTLLHGYVNPAPEA